MEKERTGAKRYQEVQGPLTDELSTFSHTKRGEERGSMERREEKIEGRGKVIACMVHTIPGKAIYVRILSDRGQ